MRIETKLEALGLVLPEPLKILANLESHASVRPLPTRGCSVR